MFKCLSTYTVNEPIQLTDLTREAIQQAISLYNDPDPYYIDRPGVLRYPAIVPIYISTPPYLFPGVFPLMFKVLLRTF